jgi:hypothetical protein
VADAANFLREWVDNGNVVNGVILDSQFVPLAFTATPVASLRRTGFIPRFDYHLLTHLDVSRNELKTVPESLSRLTRLSYLDLSENRLREIPAPVFSLEELQTLRLKGNPVTEIPADILALPQLSTLALDREERIGVTCTCPVHSCYGRVCRTVQFSDVTGVEW